MNPISNFHTHTYLCKHAAGHPADYHKQALLDGCTALGFSDHCPYPDAMPDFWPHVRMSLEEAPGYVREVQALKASSPFPVYLGFECEWDSRYASWYQDGLKGEFGADYLVLGSHWLTKGDSHLYIADEMEKASLFTYTDQTIQAMQSGLFAFLAHPDLCMAFGRAWDADVESCMKALIACAKDLNMPIEVNGLGMHKKMCQTERGMRYAYPVDEFWTLAAEAGVPVICNADAHDPKIVMAWAKESREYAARFGIVPVESIFA
ncbi:MAG: histidinol-phosphatase [Treponema sp.]|nr:histidinol-phosphatase [Treponema sp.]